METREHKHTGALVLYIVKEAERSCQLATLTIYLLFIKIALGK